VEQENFGRFLSLVVEHKHKIGFNGTILIEPKPHEPTKHQYDFDTQTVYGFLKRFGLENEVKVNIEANHATLSGHTFEHEIAMARALGIFGSIDANRGDPQNGWDTDQFPNSVEELTLACIEIERAGGFTDGGFNFDAKVRRQSIDAADLFHGHIGGVDVIARPCCAPRRSSPMAASMPSAPNATPDGMANWGRRSRARALPKSPISLWRAIWPQAGFGPAGMAGEHAQPLLTAIVGRVIGWGEVMMQGPRSWGGVRAARRQRVPVVARAAPPLAPHFTLRRREAPRLMPMASSGAGCCWNRSPSPTAPTSCSPAPMSARPSPRTVRPGLVPALATLPRDGQTIAHKGASLTWHAMPRRGTSSCSASPRPMASRPTA
jgi:hypothetical protein